MAAVNEDKGDDNGKIVITIVSVNKNTRKEMVFKAKRNPTFRDDG